jgi:putative ABC transport system ATP-binding protein
LDIVTTATLQPVLEARSIYRFFRAGDDETLALKGVSLTLRRGELVVVVGPSGSGKSTLLGILAGLDEPDGGIVRINGDRLSHRPEVARARVRATSIGVLFQSDNLLPHLTVTGNVRLVQQLSPREQPPSVPDLLAGLGLGARADAYPGELSGGELARAGLAVALANRPSVLLADEPTGELDASTESEVIGILTAQVDRGVAVLIASHSTAVAAAAHRVVRLTDGIAS